MHWTILIYYRNSSTRIIIITFYQLENILIKSNSFSSNTIYVTVIESFGRFPKIVPSRTFLD